MATSGSDKLEFISVEASSTAVPLAAAESTDATPRSDATLLGGMSGTIRQAKHPVASIFHLLFKGLALIVYLLAGMISNSYVFVFVICILLLAFDFWTVKNVTGRLLVGLRWWNRIQPDGSNEWVFESLDDMSEIGTIDSRIFWTGLYGAPVIWTMFFIISLLKFNLEWLLIVIVALMLSGANIIGYTKCRKDAKEKMQSILTSGALGALGSSAGSSILSKLTGSSVVV